VGPIQTIRLQHRSITEGARWHLSHVDVKKTKQIKSRDSSKRLIEKVQEYKFHCDRWVQDPDGVEEAVSVELHLGARPASIPYLVTVVTSQIKGAGTDGQVQISKKLNFILSS
jgi:hypothetical protein